MRGTATAFTLVEVLVTISVIGILAALLVPVLASARGKARAIVCTGNLRQWGIALLMYTNQNDGAIPRRGQGVNPLRVIDRSEDWFNCLPPYFDIPPYRKLVKQGKPPKAGDKSPFICPEATNSSSEPYFMPYAMNMYLSPWIRPEPHNIMEIPLPTCVVFMADAPGPYSATLPSRQPYSVTARHSGNANILFLDGHVQSFSGDYLGCGTGDPHRDDVRWETGTSGVNQPPLQ